MPATISIENATAVTEGDWFSFDVVLSEALVDAATVNFRTIYDTASRGDLDYSPGDLNDTLTFAPGETLKTISIESDGEGNDEVDQNLFVELYDPTGDVELEDGLPAVQASAVILDNDGVGSNLAVFVSRPLLVEGDSGETLAEFEIRLSQPATEATDFTYQTIDGTAVAGEDYEATSGTVTFSTGQTTTTVRVPVFGDTEGEDAESFSLKVAPPAGAPIDETGSVGEATIMDDDSTPAPTISVIHPGSTLEGQWMRIWVALTEPAVDAVSVDYRTVYDGAAERGDLDYSPGDLSGTLTFAPGETQKAIWIEADSESEDERDEHLVVELFNPSGGTLADGVSTLRTTGIILDNDGVGLNRALVFADQEAIEPEVSNTTIEIPVRLTRPYEEGEITFDVSVAATGDAVEGSDFELLDDTVTFAAGQTEAAVSVRILKDDEDERTEEFSLSYSPQSGMPAAPTATLQNITIYATDEAAGGGGGTDLEGGSGDGSGDGGTTDGGDGGGRGDDDDDDGDGDGGVSLDDAFVGLSYLMVGEAPDEDSPITEVAEAGGSLLEAANAMRTDSAFLSQFTFGSNLFQKINVITVTHLGLSAGSDIHSLVNTFFATNLLNGVPVPNLFVTVTNYLLNDSVRISALDEAAAAIRGEGVSLFSLEADETDGGVDVAGMAAATAADLGAEVLA